MDVLAGDIGGTKSHLAIISDLEERSIVFERKYASSQYTSFEEMLSSFLKEYGKQVSVACFGVAGIVKNGKCQMTNVPWTLDAAKTGIKKTVLINDLEANGYGISLLKKEELFALRENSLAEGNRALLSVGTGLGECFLYWNGKEHIPIPSEGGHSDFAAHEEIEWQLFSWMKKQKEAVSWEDLLSGKGIENIYRFFVGEDRDPHAVSDAAHISERALKRTCPLSVATLDLFTCIYGRECGNVALRFLSFGGVYLGGGIPPKVLPFLKKELFLKALQKKSRFSKELASIPVYVITNEKTALLGAAFHARSLL